MFWKKSTIKKVLPFPVKASHREYSMILSTHDDPAIATPSLLDVSLNAVSEAKKIDLIELSLRMKEPPYFPNIWPGEHYKLLAGLVKALQPKTIIEIGTATGLSALSMKKYLPKDGQIITFDIISWKNYESTVLKEKDFQGEALLQYTDDLSRFENVEKHMKILEKADLIFIDATHDGKLEKILFDHLHKIAFEKNPYLVFDDIRVWSMIKMWREIEHPKLDLTSFGHWSGTGIVEWSKAKTYSSSKTEEQIQK